MCGTTFATVYTLFSSRIIAATVVQYASDQRLTKVLTRFKIIKILQNIFEFEMECLNIYKVYGSNLKLY